MINNKKKKRLNKQSYKSLFKAAVDTGVAFNDSEFKSEDLSVGLSTSFKARLNVGRIVWKRPREIVDDPHLLFKQKLGPGTAVDFVGNGLNQWLIAAALLVAQDKSLIYKIFPKDQFHFLHGIFKVHLWNFSKLYRIVIDDKLPTFDNELVFSSSNCSTVYWLPLLEKAFAKLYGSYESLSINCNIKDALHHLCGAPVELIKVDSSDDEKEYFRMIAEELDKKSLICAQSKNGLNLEKGPNSVKNNRYYLIKCVKKPSTGTFKKGAKDSPAMIRIVDTICEEKNTSRKSFTVDQLHEFWIPIDNFTKFFESLVICRMNILNTKRSTKQLGPINSQFCFDITGDFDEIMIDILQKTLDQPRIGFKIYQVDMNREYRLHNISNFNSSFSVDQAPGRSVFKRIKLSLGRYVLMPVSSNLEAPILLGLYSQRHTNLRILEKDMPQLNILPFLSPKYPQYISRVVVKCGQNLEKQDRFGSANPFCVIKCARSAVKSPPVNDSLNPDWKDFSGIFYHGKVTKIIIEVWHSGLLVNTYMGHVEVMPQLSGDDLNTVQELQLCGRKKGHSRPGTIKFQVDTSEDLRKF